MKYLFLVLFFFITQCTYSNIYNSRHTKLEPDNQCVRTCYHYFWLGCTTNEEACRWSCTQYTIELKPGLDTYCNCIQKSKTCEETKTCATLL